MPHMQAENAEAEATPTTRAEDRARWMDGILDEENQMIALYIFIALVIWLVVMFITAPEGYEDDSGFYLGRKENK